MTLLAGFGENARWRKGGRQKGVFCVCVITDGFRESSEEYNLITLIHADGVS